jgi:NitT/TauT family transport system permease protein
VIGRIVATSHDFAKAILKRRWALRFCQVLFGLAIIGLWEGLSQARVVQSFALPLPWQVADDLGHWFTSGTGISGSIWSNVGATLEVTVIGFLIGMALGTLIGILSGTVPVFKYAVNPFLSFFNAIPRLVLIPIFVGWLGFGDEPRIIVVVLTNVFLVAAVVQGAVEDIEGVIIAHARVLGASWSQMFRTVYVPGVGIWVVSLSRQCFGHAITAACVSEFFGAKKGLGFLISYGQMQFDAREIYAAVILTAVIGFLFDILLQQVDRRANRYLVR